MDCQEDGEEAASADLVTEPKRTLTEEAKKRVTGLPKFNVVALA